MSNRRTSWSFPTDPETVRRRAGGRRHYNAHRRNLREFRRLQVAKLLLGEGLRTTKRGTLTEHGLLAKIAKKLGVSRATICRDRKALLEKLHKYRCPKCGEVVPPYSLTITDIFGEPVEESEEQYEQAGADEVDASADTRGFNALDQILADLDTDHLDDTDRK